MPRVTELRETNLQEIDLQVTDSQEADSQETDSLVTGSQEADSRITMSDYQSTADTYEEYSWSDYIKIAGAFAIALGGGVGATLAYYFLSGSSAAENDAGVAEGDVETDTTGLVAFGGEFGADGAKGSTFGAESGGDYVLAAVMSGAEEAEVPVIVFEGSSGGDVGRDVGREVGLDIGLDAGVSASEVDEQVVATTGEFAGAVEVAGVTAKRDVADVLGVAGVSKVASVAGDEVVLSADFGENTRAAIIPRSSGGYAVAWNNEVAFGDPNDEKNVFISCLSENLAVESGSAIMSETTLGFQSSPSLVELTNGDIVGGWTGEEFDITDVSARIYNRVFDANCSPNSNEFVADVTVIGSQSSTSLFSRSSSEYRQIFVNREPFSTNIDYMAQIHDASGVQQGAAVQINPNTVRDRVRFSSAMVDNDRTIAVWRIEEVLDPGPGRDENIFLQLSNSMVPIDSEIQVNTNQLNINNGNLSWNSVTCSENSTCLIAWSDITDNVAGRLYNANDRSFITDEFQISESAAGLNGVVYTFTLTSDVAGVLWRNSILDGEQGGIFGRRVSLIDGHPMGRQFPVTQYTNGDQSFPSGVSTPDGGFVAAWYSFEQGLREHTNHGGLVLRKFPAAPTMFNYQNAINIPEGGTVNLCAPGMPYATDMDSPSSEIMWMDIASGLEDIHYEEAANSGVVITEFSELQRAICEIVAVHNGNNSASAFSSLKVDDAYFDDGPYPLNFSVLPYDDPSLVFTNVVLLIEGQFAVTGIANFRLEDSDSTAEQINIGVVSVSHAQQEHLSAENVAIASYTYQEHLDNLVGIRPDGSENIPELCLLACHVSCSDVFCFNPLNENMFLRTVNDPPQFSGNPFTITNGGNITIGPELFSFTDEEQGPNEVGGIFQAEAMNIVQVNDSSIVYAGQTIPQEDINSRKWALVHKGNNTEPSLRVFANDSNSVVGPFFPAMSFAGDATNSTGPEPSPISAGAIVGGSVAALAVAGGAGFAFFSRSKNRDDDNSRADYLIANSAYRKLKISGTSNFKKGKGPRFLQIISDIVSAIKSQDEQGSQQLVFKTRDNEDIHSGEDDVADSLLELESEIKSQALGRNIGLIAMRNINFSKNRWGESVITLDELSAEINNIATDVLQGFYYVADEVDAGGYDGVYLYNEVHDEKDACEIPAIIKDDALPSDSSDDIYANSASC